MLSARKKWDLSIPSFTNLYSPKNNVSSSSDSEIDVDHENNLRSASKYLHVKNSPDMRSPLVEVNRNENELNQCQNIRKVISNNIMRAKSCPNANVSAKKKRSKYNLAYNLRKTPDRLSRLLTYTSPNESDEFLDANENLEASPIIPQPDARILRNRSMYLTSTAKKASKNRVSFAQISPANEKFSYILNPDLTEHDVVNCTTDKSTTDAGASCTSEVFHTPIESFQSSLNVKNLLSQNRVDHDSINQKIESMDKATAVPENSINLVENKPNKSEDENMAERRGSYVVMNSVFNPCDLPQTPAVRRSPRLSTNNSLTSEDTSLFRVNYVNRRSIKRLQPKKSLSNFMIAKKSVLRRKTVCQPFHLITDERYPKSEASSTVKEFSFNSMLRRNNTPKIPSKSRRITKVSPFNFALSSTRKRPHNDDEDAYMPLAERVAAHFKTPTRFRSTSRLTVFQPPAKKSSPEFVRPKTPKLHTMKRRRTVNVLSREQQLELEAIQMRKYRFRAKPFNPNVLNRPVLKETTKQPTIPEEFNLATDKRIQARKCTEKPEEPKYEFKARKVPKHVLLGPSNAKDKTPLPSTLPQSPRFSLKEREVKWRNFCSSEESDPEVFRFKATPAPVRKSPRVINPQPKKTLTTVQPFTFDERDKIRYMNKEKKIQEELDEKSKPFRFRASEIPSSVSTPRLPAHQMEKKLPTVPLPFNLHPGNYSSRKNDSDYEVPKVPSKIKFKAKPATVLKKKPFIPLKCATPVVENLDFHLYTQERAKVWDRLKEERMSLELEKEVAMQKYLQEQDEKDKEELRQLRQELVHKAQPLPKYKTFEVKPSDKPATTPHSPAFATKQRSLQKLTMT